MILIKIFVILIYCNIFELAIFHDQVLYSNILSAQRDKKGQRVGCVYIYTWFRVLECKCMHV